MARLLSYTISAFTEAKVLPPYRISLEAGSAKKPIKNSLVKPTIWRISCFLRTFARKFSNIDWSSRGPREPALATLTWDAQKSCAETISANVLKWRLSYQQPTATSVSAAVASSLMILWTLQDYLSGNQLLGSRQSCLPARNDRCKLYVWCQAS